MNAATFTKQIMDFDNLLDAIVAEGIFGREETEGGWFEHCSPPPEFGAESAIAFRGSLFFEIDVCFVLDCTAMTAALVCFPHSRRNLIIVVPEKGSPEERDDNPVTSYKPCPDKSDVRSRLFLFSGFTIAERFILAHRFRLWRRWRSERNEVTPTFLIQWRSRCQIRPTSSNSTIYDRSR